MTTTTDRPITVDGVRLDSLAWNVTAIQRATAGRRSADQTVPGVDGALPSYNDNLEPATFGLDMFVRGTTADGQVPAEGARDRFRANLDELVHLFGKRHALLDVRQTTAAGVERRAWAKVVDVIAPDVNTLGTVGQFTVGMTLPYGVWEDPAENDWSNPPGSASGTVAEVTTLQGATERITDAVFLVLGPVTNPRITDVATGAYVQLNQTLVAGQRWRVNCATWKTHTGGDWLWLNTPDTEGTDAQATTVFGGTRNQAVFLPLVPTRTDTDPVRRVKVALSGAGFGASTQVVTRTRRKYAL